MDIKSAKKILEKVKHDYNLIAKEWDAKRAAPRPFQMKLTKQIKKGERVLDVGCGNGVLYDVLAPKSIDYVGMDVSDRLLRIAKKRVRQKYKMKSLNVYPEPSRRIKFVKSSILKIPFKNETFDWVLALAVLHHLPGPYQKRAAEEIYRVLKPGGRVVISVWDLYSDYVLEHFKIKEQLKHRPAGWGQNDLEIPWKATPRKLIKRYIYRFSRKELADLFQKAGFKNARVRLVDASGRWTADVNRGYNFVLTAKK